jgi:hypothetical protein
MKNTLPLLFLGCFVIGCADPKPTHKETVSTYYEAFNAGDYPKIKTVIHDSITLIEGDYTMPFDHDSYYDHFQWDSVFKPTYELLKLEEKDDQLITTVASSSVRYAFLKNNTLTTNLRISFTQGKISKIEILEGVNTDWDAWQKERDSLVDWTHKNHPELDGFINDLSRKGALNYVKAIGYYQTHKKVL